MVEISIENVVATASIGQDLDLKAITTALEDAEYEPKQFPGVVYRLKKPKTATLIFRSGKVVCTGAKNIEDVHTAVKTVVKTLAKMGIQVNKNPSIVVQNIVATVNLNTELNLETTAITLGLDNVEYEPEVFPGLVYRLSEPKVVMLLFTSGKIVCTGGKTVENIKEAVQKLNQELTTAGLIKRAR